MLFVVLVIGNVYEKFKQQDNNENVNYVEPIHRFYKRH